MKFDSLCNLLNEAVYGQPSDLYRKPKNRNMEYIVAAAVMDPETDDIGLGDNHMEAYHELNNPKSYETNIRGFYTNKKRFVIREEALSIAKKNKQAEDPFGYPKRLDSMDISIAS